MGGQMNLAETQTAKAAITTVIPTYRRPKLLRRAIQSVLNQTYSHFQVCVYDNASGDETEAVVAEIMRRDPRVHYHRHPENIGLVRNFAYGAAQVATPFLNFLSDDDLVLPRFFETAMAAFERYPQAGMFVGETIEAAQNGSNPRSSPWREGIYEPPNGLFYAFQASANWTGMVFRWDALRALGDLDPDAGEQMDCDLTLRICSRYPVVASRVPCGLFFYGGASSQSPLCDWIETHMRVKAKIEADEALSSGERARLGSAIEQWLAAASFHNGLVRAACLGRLHDARVAADLFRRLGCAPWKVRLAELFAAEFFAGRSVRSAFSVAHAVRSRAHWFFDRRHRRELRAVMCEALDACGDERHLVAGEFKSFVSRKSL